MRRRRVATPGEWQCKTARSGEWAQHFSNASCYYIPVYFRIFVRCAQINPTTFRLSNVNISPRGGNKMYVNSTKLRGNSGIEYFSRIFHRYKFVSRLPFLPFSVALTELLA